MIRGPVEAWVIGAQWSRRSSGRRTNVERGRRWVSTEEERERKLGFPIRVIMINLYPQTKFIFKFNYFQIFI
uniref:Uncharacterized protein n=1 Tax=Cannabis sativa TaxID=3483 RepID=A0A803R9Q0_CANSA